MHNINLRYATQYTRMLVEKANNPYAPTPERDMTRRIPISTGRKPVGYIKPAHTNPKLEARVQDWIKTGKPDAYKKPGSMKP